jgi:transcriptional regulator with XRE-family HTH domain
MNESTRPMPAGGAKAAAVHNTRSLSMRTDKAVVNRTVAERLLNARELNGYSQTKGAELLGYKTPAQLNQWEMSRRPVPLRMLIRASHVYRVSMDYLVGISDEPDRDPNSAIRRQVVSASEQMLSSMTMCLADAIIQQTKMGGPAIETALLIVDEGERLVKAFKRFVELNAATFEDMRGGAPLNTAAMSFEANGLATARAQIDRFLRANTASAKDVASKLRQHSANDDLFARGGA